MNGEIAAYRGLATSLARKFIGRNGAELDDLVQEAFINVWQTLQRGVTPSAEIIEYRMESYVKWLGRQAPVPYEAMLPIDDLRLASGGTL
jgi:hypothetical protein